MIPASIFFPLSLSLSHSLSKPPRSAAAETMDDSATHSKKRTEFAEAPSPPHASKMRRIGAGSDGEGSELLTTKCEHHQLSSGSLEKTAASPDSGELLSADSTAASSGSNSSELPRFSKDCECSVDIAGERAIVADQQAKSLETEASTCNNGDSSVSEETATDRAQSEELSANSARTMEEPPSPPAKIPAASERTRQQEAKMPSQAEIESFFSAAEKYEQKRFAERYNYDVVNDVPLEGRYEWIRLKPWS